MGNLGRRQIEFVNVNELSEEDRKYRDDIIKKIAYFCDRLQRLVREIPMEDDMLAGIAKNLKTPVRIALRNERQYYDVK